MQQKSEAADIERAARAICKSQGVNPRSLNADGQPAWKGWVAAAKAARKELLRTGDGEQLFTLELSHAERVCARLEFDASWDKVGPGYYLLKQQLQAQDGRAIRRKETP
ncbi:hypothetical protein [Bosea massiliensis]|uniref:Uncharacterized protein n=1 Tax=Bosea massiliensis TaxID=151419 RepID=A0ABW0NZE5_9HYPH